VRIHNRFLLCILLIAPITSHAAGSTRLGVDPAEGGGSASCIFGANGTVVFAPPGADCAKVAVAATPVSEDEFVAPTASKSGAWLPAETGVEKLFVHVVERREQTGSSPETKRVLRGTRHEVFGTAREPKAAGAVEMRVTQRVSGPGRPERTETELHTLVPTSNAYQIQSSIIEWKGGRKDVVYQTPVKMLPDSLAKGATWQVSRGAFDEVSIVQTGEILGFQNVNTPSGPFTDCLVVRYRTTLSGRGMIGGVPEEVTDGEVVRTVWFARGVGMVLSKAEMHETVEVFGQPTAVRVRTQSGLKGVKRTLSAPADSTTP
jgi:hypothetical protein